ncbi:MAG TPA: hybrid sensor histidine kinase/response regulator [Steroidobacteraceae bacterium]|jgi:two-component system sensor histidine kinase and response regulator WspE|nr:hybrid sensor histidine kinase/response regulator [Steroidobacteraceae bacterium]
MSATGLAHVSMLELYRHEADERTEALTAGLLALERDPRSAAHLESCMRAAHSLKGAARVVGIATGVDIAHAMESCFVAAQTGALTLDKARIDVLLRAVDLLRRISQAAEGEIAHAAGLRPEEVRDCLAALGRAAAGAPAADEAAAAEEALSATPGSSAGAPRAGEAMPAQAEQQRQGGSAVRITAETLDRLLGLAGESLVEARWLTPFSQSLLRLKRQQYDLGGTLDRLREALAREQGADEARALLTEAQSRALECRQFLASRLAELETFDRQVSGLSRRLYAGALACRMRPFADGLRGLPRMTRDLAQSLHKQVRLVTEGHDTPVDRDVLEQLEASLTQLLRNAIDHGIESPQVRLAAGKPAEGVIRVEARHSAGRLLVTVADDGAGVELDELRKTLVTRGLANAEAAAAMNEAELFEFLLLPGFTLASSVTEISGRGVGLDVVRELLRRLRGTIRVASRLGEGTQFQLHLPLTMSVVRTLLIEVGGEAYALPLASISCALKLSRTSIVSLSGRAHFSLRERRIGLVSAHQVLETRSATATTGEISVVVLKGGGGEVGLVVDRLLGERELVIQPLDARLGKIKDVSAGGLMEDGTPVLILDVEDVARSMEKFASGGDLAGLAANSGASAHAPRKRVLVIDDSLTVRELERKLLTQGGYDVEVAVDGMDGWNAIRAGRFDLIVTDIDMPRLDGIELVRLVRQDPRLKSLPVMIVSYKDRPEDRHRGLEAGADYYLAKAGFHDQTLLSAVAHLIGRAAS